MKHTVFPVPRFPHNFCLTANEKDFSLPLEMTMQERRHSPSFLYYENLSRVKNGAKSTPFIILY